MTTEAERDCKHGQLARSCNVCELESEIEQLKSEMEDQYPCIERLRTAVALKNGVIKTLQDEANDARVEIERANALLRQALDVIQSECGYGGTNDYEPRAICDAIKTHLGDV